MQIYRWMDIGTAKPSRDIRAAIPHHLIDILDPDQNYNAGRFVQDADKVIEKLQPRKKPAILLGGTSLYLKSLIHGIIPVPYISEPVKTQINQLIENKGVKGCYQKLEEIDPESALKLHPNDVSRISRALEVVWETGKSIQLLQHQHQFRQRRYEVFFIGTYWPRVELYQRIDQRVLKIINDGLIEESENLLRLGYSPDLAPLKSIGYKQAFQYLDQKISKTEMIADIQQKSRHYAKKQITWYKGDARIKQLTCNRLTPKILTQVDHFLNA